MDPADCDPGAPCGQVGPVAPCSPVAPCDRVAPREERAPEEPPRRQWPGSPAYINKHRDAGHAKIVSALGGLGEAGAAAAAAGRADALERVAYNAAVRAWRARPGGGPAQQKFPAAYESTVGEVASAITSQTGPFPDDIPGEKYLKGELTAEALVAEAQGPAAQKLREPDQRETIRRALVRSLIAGGCDRERAARLAQALEVSCFNAAVLISKESEDPPRRQWDSPAFVDIYSTRCGTIIGLLDPESSACRAYGATLLWSLLAGEVRPEAVGAMAEWELCPRATAAERDEIARRQAQKIDYNESELFQCPHCEARLCQYKECQLRSADEAPDYLCLCSVCNRRFVVRS